MMHMSKTGQRGNVQATPTQKAVPTKRPRRVTLRLRALGAAAALVLALGGVGAMRAQPASADAIGYDLLLQESWSRAGITVPGYVSWTFSSWYGAYRCYYDGYWYSQGYWVLIPGSCHWI
jgi:hypothetical protein